MADAGAAPAEGTLRERVEDALRTVYDPEIPVNIYELGLIYDVDITDEGVVRVKMTLTAPSCPVAGIIPGEVEAKVRAVEGVTDAEVDLVWDSALGRVADVGSGAPRTRNDVSSLSCRSETLTSAGDVCRASAAHARTRARLSGPRHRRKADRRCAIPPATRLR